MAWASGRAHGAMACAPVRARRAPSPQGWDPRDDGHDGHSQASNAARRRRLLLVGVHTMHLAHGQHTVSARGQLVALHNFGRAAKVSRNSHPPQSAFGRADCEARGQPVRRAQGLPRAGWAGTDLSSMATRAERLACPCGRTRPTIVNNFPREFHSRNCEQPTLNGYTSGGQQTHC